MNDELLMLNAELTNSALITQHSALKKVPEIRFKGFSGEWNYLTLGENAKFTKGQGYSKGDLVNSGAQIILYGRLYTKYQTVITNVDTFVIEKDKSVKSMGGEVIVPASGESPEDISRASVVSKPNMILGGDLNVVLPSKNIHSTFLALAISNGRLKKELSSKAQGKSVVHIRNSDLADLGLILPAEYIEQTAIGNYFQKLDSLINQHQQQHAKLSNIKKAMLEKMFPKPGETTPEIRFKGFSGEWVERELGTDVAEIIGGGTPSTSISDFWNGDIDWYSPTEIGSNVYVEGSQKKITALGLKSSSAKILPAGNTVLFTSRAGIGDMAILAKPGATNQGFQSFIIKEGFSPYFVYSAGKQIKEFALKHASGSTFLEISGKQLGRMKILIPSEKEQTAIGNYFQKLDELINQHQQQISKLTHIKQSFLSKMFV